MYEITLEAMEKYVHEVLTVGRRKDSQVTRSRDEKPSSQVNTKTSKVTKSALEKKKRKKKR